MNEDHAAMFQQQLQALLMQREQLNLQLLELRTAITELEKTAEKQVYKLAGPVLVKKPVEEVLADLKEKQELVTLRLQAIEKSETRTKERMQVLEKSPSKESAK
ncbi:MAG TPA: prefoldin subunit [archaeon]|nr:prefoldin subunit [archaeon]